jgi:hypothetical protein
LVTTTAPLCQVSGTVSTCLPCHDTKNPEMAERSNAER